MKKNKIGESQNIVTEQDFQETANRVSLVTILLNALLSIFKLVAGLRDDQRCHSFRIRCV